MGMEPRWPRDMSEVLWAGVVAAVAVLRAVEAPITLVKSPSESASSRIGAMLSSMPLLIGATTTLPWPSRR